MWGLYFVEGYLAVQGLEPTTFQSQGNSLTTRPIYSGHGVSPDYFGDSIDNERLLMLNTNLAYEDHG